MTSELMFIIKFYVTNIENIKRLEYNDQFSYKVFSPCLHPF